MKDLNLNYEGFEEYLVEREDSPTMNCNFEEAPGVRYVFRFENNYGASVVKHLGSYGYDEDLWELAVIRFGKYDELCIEYFENHDCDEELEGLLDAMESDEDDEDDEDDEYDLTYDTPITDDVEGYLTDEDVRNLLARIKEL